jgi:Right handed beta helix region
VGTILPDGLYTAPATGPANASVTVTAQSSYDPNTSASATALISPSYIPPSHPKLTTYYLDATGGNDSNSGTSPETAWKNLDQIYLNSVNSSNIPAGSQILLKAGESWDGQIRLGALGTSHSAVVLGSYGTGANPIIYGDMHTATWSAVPGYSGIYQASAGRGSLLNSAYQGTMALTYNDPGSLNLTNPRDLNTYLSGFSPGNWGPNSTSGTTQTLVYVATLDGRAPTNVSVFRAMLVYLGSGSYVTAQNLDMRQTYNGMFISTSNTTVQGTSVQDALGIGFEISSASNVLVQNNSTNRTGNDGIYSESGSNNIFQNNAISHVQRTILGITTGGDQCGIGLNSNSNSLVQDNSFEYIFGSCFDNYYETNSTIRRNYCYHFDNLGAAPHGTGNVYYDNVFDAGADTPWGGISASDVGGGTPTLIYNNTIYGIQPPGSGGYGISGHGAGQLVFKNNIVYTLTGQSLLAWSNTNGSSALRHHLQQSGSLLSDDWPGHSLDFCRSKICESWCC